MLWLPENITISLVRSRCLKGFCLMSNHSKRSPPQSLTPRSHPFASQRSKTDCLNSQVYWLLSSSMMMIKENAFKLHQVPWLPLKKDCPWYQHAPLPFIEKETQSNNLIKLHSIKVLIPPAESTFHRRNYLKMTANSMETYGIGLPNTDFCGQTRIAIIKVELHWLMFVWLYLF